MCLWGRKSPISTQSYKRYDFFTPSLNHCFVTITLSILEIPPLFVIWDSGAYIVHRCSDLCSGGRLTNAKSTSPMLGLVYILASYQYIHCNGIEYNCSYGLCAMPATSALQRKYNYKYNQYNEKRQKNLSIHTNTAKVQYNCCNLTSPILRVAGSMPAAGSTIFGQSTCLSILIHRFEV